MRSPEAKLGENSRSVLAVPHPNYCHKLPPFRLAERSTLATQSGKTRAKILR
jgi:hypothetical protein